MDSAWYSNKFQYVLAGSGRLAPSMTFLVSLLVVGVQLHTHHRNRGMSQPSFMYQSFLQRTDGEDGRG